MPNGEPGAEAGTDTAVSAPKRRESALEKLRRQLAENAAEMPPL
jgi:hypothetical protein